MECNLADYLVIINLFHKAVIHDITVSLNKIKLLKGGF